MKYYNEIVPFKVAKKLKEAGFPQAETLSLYKSSGDAEKGEILDKTEYIFAPCYASVIDWLIEKGFSVEVFRYNNTWRPSVAPPSRKTEYFPHSRDWFKAADQAILWSITKLNK
jgi:hypothetical protein